MAAEQSEEWVTGRRYLNMGELRERRGEEQEGEEVAFVERRGRYRLGENCRTFGA